MRREKKLSVDAYLKACEEWNIPPNKPASGKMLLRLPADLHCNIMQAAEADGRSANQFVVDALSSACASHASIAGAKTKNPPRHAVRRRSARVPAGA
jgi:predicted HicB family RNase H-like nuclease